jgi:FKBP-type peptidyl-prolyl cis-trans isomerase FkpA
MRYLSTIIVLALGCAAATAFAQPALNTDQDKTLYALGLALGQNIKDFKLTANELALVQAGLADIVSGKQAKVDLETFGPKLQAFARDRASAAAAEEKKASAAFLDSLAKQPGAVRNPTSGVVYIPVKEGTGAAPKANDKVKVHYHGTLRDGSVFDSSVQRGEPISFPLDGVIPCWTEAVQKMKVGGKAKLGCPSETAYGDGGQGPIPGGAALVFEVELLGIEQ